MSEVVLEMKGITKIYGNGILANDKVDFSVKAGEIHAIMGENGAGKSTLMKMIFGIERPDDGEIFYKGKPVKINSPTDALEMGIGMVHQHFMLVPSLTVAENMVLRKEPRKGIALDMNKAIEETLAVAQKYNLPIDPHAKVSELAVGMKQRVEILKALYRGAKILILDEPTAVLTPQETEELFKQLKHLRDQGHTVIFISHKIREIKELCNRITIMRNGRSMGVYEVEGIGVEEISSLMVGRDIVTKIDKKPKQIGEKVLNVSHLTYGYAQEKMSLKDVSFSIRRGEIVGIAGVEGNGQLELVEIITALRKLEEGKIEIVGKDLSHANVRQIRDAKVGHIPQDRFTYGAAGDATIAENLISDVSHESRFHTGFLLSTKKIKAYAQKLIKEFQVKCDSEAMAVKMLSGGNVQKVVAARELTGELDFVIADQPTRGIDIGTANFIHRRLVELRDSGVGVLLISADLNEIMELSDSMMVMYDGEIVAYFEDASVLTESELGQYMLGLKKQTPEQIKEVCHD